MPSPADSPISLKEIANRLKRLSYRDMQRLAFLLDEQGHGEETATTLLNVADRLENE